MQPSASSSAAPYVRRTYAKGNGSGNGKHKWSIFANSSEGSRARRKAKRAHLQPGIADRSGQSTPPLPPPPPVQPLIPAPPSFVKGTGKGSNSSEGSRARRNAARARLQPGIADRSGKSAPPLPPPPPPEQPLIPASPSFVKGTGKGSRGQPPPVAMRPPPHAPPPPPFFKGTGKGSLGDDVPMEDVPLEEVPIEDVPVQEIPPPIKQTEAQIAQTIAEHYRPFPATWDGNVASLKKGMSVLWKGIKKTRSGNISGKVEYFNGIFHGFGTSKEWVIVN